jgi:ankyrin repeat protein
MLNSIKEGTGKTAIHIAAARGDVEIFKYLEG